jgi:hypothetical protein
MNVEITQNWVQELLCLEKKDKKRKTNYIIKHEKIYT